MTVTTDTNVTDTSADDNVRQTPTTQDPDALGQWVEELWAIQVGAQLDLEEAQTDDDREYLQHGLRHIEYMLEGIDLGYAPTVSPAAVARLRQHREGLGIPSWSELVRLAEGDEYFESHVVEFINRAAAARVRREKPRSGRNAPCACGSGLKTKKCSHA
jgi:hypothetical protein